MQAFSYVKDVLAAPQLQQSRKKSAADWGRKGGVEAVFCQMIVA
jgi:hypothetical protein